MTRFDSDAQVAKQNIMQMCMHMSAAYLAPVLNDAELMLVSRHQTHNAVTRRIVEILTPMAAGAAFQVIREIRTALLPLHQSGSLTLRGLRQVSAAHDKGTVFATQEVR